MSDLNDRSDGLWRRLIMLPFPVTIPEAMRNPHLTEGLSSELSGIFNWAVWGAGDLNKRGRFIEPVSCRDALQTFKRDTNAARLFLEENYEASLVGEVGKDHLYGSYKNHCLVNGHRPLNAPNFFKEVMRVFPTAVESKPRRGGSRSRMYSGFTQKCGERHEGGGSRAA